MANGYKKYMKKEAQKNSPLLKIFIVSFFGMLLICTFVINYLSKNLSVDTSIGDYKEQKIEDMDEKKIVDLSRLEMIQSEDRGRDFTETTEQPQNKEAKESINDTVYEDNNKQILTNFKEEQPTETTIDEPKEVNYKVYIGSYTSAEQARVAKEIIQDSGNGLTPIVKAVGAENYTLQVGSFKNRKSAQSMLNTVLQAHLPGRISEE